MTKKIKNLVDEGFRVSLVEKAFFDGVFEIPHINSPDEIDQIEKGEILVTVATNIGWTLAFPKVSAIITDIGAPLSHAAIVAREFGIPAVVGCGNATTVLKTGDIIEVDGSRGTVVKKD